MNIIAVFTENDNVFGLTADPVNGNFYHNDFTAVFSLHNNGSRTSCHNLGRCSSTECSLNSPTTLPCYKDLRHYLPKFGITQNTHPEYFI